MVRVLLAALVASLLLARPSVVTAQSSGDAKIVITAPGHGTAYPLRVMAVGTELFNPELAVAGTVWWPHPGAPRVQVMGDELLPGQLQQTGPDTWEFAHSMTIPLDPTLGGVWPPGFPAIDAYRTPAIIMLPVLVEVLDAAGTLVLARDRVAIYNTAAYGGGPGWTQSTGWTVSTQISQAGAKALSEVHRRTLPWPDGKSYAQELRAQAKAQKTVTSSWAEPACLPLPDVPGMRDSGAFEIAKNLARDQHDLYVYCVTQLAATPVGPVAAEAICAEAACVTEAPVASNFEVCVGEIAANLNDADVGKVVRSDLRFRGPSTKGPSHGGVGVAVELADPTGRSTLTLRDVTVRWIGSATCQALIHANVNANDFKDAKLDAWRTCAGVQIQADDAHSTPLPGDKDGNVGFDVLRESCASAPGQLECENVRRVHEPAFALSKPVTVDLGTSTCLEPWTSGRARDAAAKLRDAIGDAIAKAWTHGGKEHGHAQALDRLFGPIELTNRSFDGYNLTARLRAIDTFWSARGLLASYTTTATPNLMVNGSLPHGIFFQWPGDLLDLLDGDGYDLAYDITTPLLNDVLDAFARTKTFNFSVDVQGGGWLFPLDEAAQQTSLAAPLASKTKGSQSGEILDGWAREALQPLIDWLGDGTYRLEVRTTLAPFTAMQETETGCAGDHCSLDYELGQLELRLVDADDNLLLLAYADFRDGDLQFGFQPIPTAKDGFLIVGLGSSNWSATIVESALPPCPMAPRVAEGACERYLEQQLAQVVRSLIDPRLIAALSQIPAPDHWNASGHAPIAASVQGGVAIQNHQHIILEGQF